MRRTYNCPRCQGLLNPNVKIILRAEHQGSRGLMLFSPQPGNYEVIIPEGFALTKKDVVRFSCPICGRDLTSTRDRDWASIDYSTDAGEEGQVVFSRVFGHHATYFITDEKVRPYGQHTENEAVNFWGVGRER
jgi:predicted RNA-binding Zn-ribbon protein involved in translation (DUF1610 family)